MASLLMGVTPLTMNLEYRILVRLSLRECEGKGATLDTVLIWEIETCLTPSSLMRMGLLLES